MSPEELQQQNVKQQIELMDNQFKKECRKEALRIASGNKPYQAQGLNSLGQGQSPHFDLIGEAEKIYQWLIKV